MKKIRIRKVMEEMYKSVTDPEEIEKNKRKTERAQRREEKIVDVGL